MFVSIDKPDRHKPTCERMYSDLTEAVRIYVLILTN